MKIPFDELEVFHKDQFQEYVDETLIVSTIVYEYLSGRERNSNFILTKRQIYILRGAEPLVAVPTKILLRIIRSKHHPELVIQFAEKQQAIRLATTTIDRCQLIVQGLSYVSNLFYQRPLLCFTLETSSLAEFVGESGTSATLKGNEETVAQRLLRQCTNIEPLYYTQNQTSEKRLEEQNPEKILYVISDKYKIGLKKITFKEKLRQIDGYSMFICKLEEELVICRVYQKTHCSLSEVPKHTNHSNCQNLYLVIETEHKYFMFFEYIQVTSFVTEKYFKELIKLITTSDLRHYTIRKRSIILGIEGPKWKQTRYFKEKLNTSPSIDFSYTPPQCLFEEGLESFQQKIYSIGVLLYHIIYKALPFLTDDWEISIYIKQVESVRFPKYLKCYLSNQFKEFIQKCTAPTAVGRFRNLEEMKEHRWYNDNIQ